jgi:hypothetical protein
MKLFSTILIVFFSLYNLSGYSQSVFDNVDTLNYPYHLWNDVVIKSCNSAANAEYMTIEEKNIVWLHNLARFDGALFARTFLKEYIEKNNMKYTPYVKSLFKDLRKKAYKLPLLKPSEHIYDLAKSHAVWSGKKSKTGHQKFSDRAKKSGHSRFSENANYGSFLAMDIFMSLLIDESVKSLGHRYNILDLHAKVIGVSIQPHKSYNYNCVIDYGG